MLQWTWECIYLCKWVFSFSINKTPETKLLNHMVVLFLIIWNIPILFSILATPIYIPMNNEWWFPFLYILELLLFLFDNSHSDRCDAISLFWFLFPSLLVMVSTLYEPASHLYVCFGKMSIQVNFPFFSHTFWSFIIQMVKKKKSTCSAGDPSLIPKLGRSSGKGNGYPLQFSCLENSMDRGAW